MTKKTTKTTEPAIDPTAQRRAELGAIIGDPFSTYHDRKRARRELAELGTEPVSVTAPVDEAPTSPGASPEPIPDTAGD